MTESDRLRIWVQDVMAAIGLLSRLPVPTNAERARSRMAESAWAYPVAGAVIGLIAAIVAGLAGWVGLPPTTVAGLVLATTIIITGAMHEDGLADTADGFWGGWDRTRRLEIMKDSHIGTYGVLALLLSVGLRWAALSYLFLAGMPVLALIGLGALSRAPMVALMAWVPNARGFGLSASVGAPAPTAAWIAISIAALLGLMCFGLQLAWIIVIAAVVLHTLALTAKVKIGGQTGDILGAAQQVTEISILLTLCTLN